MKPNVIAICIMNQNSTVSTLSRHTKEMPKYREVCEGHEAVHADLPGREGQRIGFERRDDACRKPKPRIGAIVKY